MKYTHIFKNSTKNIKNDLHRKELDTNIIKYTNFLKKKSLLLFFYFS